MLQGRQFTLLPPCGITYHPKRTKPSLIPPCNSSSHIYPLLQDLYGKHELSVTMILSDLHVPVMEVGHTTETHTPAP